MLPKEIGADDSVMTDIKKLFSVQYSALCLPCLAEYLEVTEEELLAKIEEFKNEGCTLFK